MFGLRGRLGNMAQTNEKNGWPESDTESERHTFSVLLASAQSSLCKFLCPRSPLNSSFPAQVLLARFSAQVDASSLRELSSQNVSRCNAPCKFLCETCSLQVPLCKIVFSEVVLNASAAKSCKTLWFLRIDHRSPQRVMRDREK